MGNEKKGEEDDVGFLVLSGAIKDPDEAKQGKKKRRREEEAKEAKRRKEEDEEEEDYNEDDWTVAVKVDAEVIQRPLHCPLHPSSLLGARKSNARGDPTASALSSSSSLLGARKSNARGDPTASASS